MSVAQGDCPLSSNAEPNPITAQNERKLRYELVRDWVLDHIRVEHLGPGERLPTSIEIARSTGSSLISVRRALEILEREGRIRRHQGIGTFVARDRIASEPNRPGELLKTLAGTGKEPALTTELLHLAVGLPGEAIAKALSITVDQPVWEVVRRRLLGRAPAILEQAVLPLSLVSSLDSKKLAAGESMYQFLADRYGLQDDYSEQSLEVVPPTQVEREALELGPREQVVRIRGVSFTEASRAFDCYQQTYRASDFVFYTSGSGHRRILQPADIGEWIVLPLSGGPTGVLRTNEEKPSRRR